MKRAYFELRVNISDRIPGNCEVRETLPALKGVDCMVKVYFFV